MSSVRQSQHYLLCIAALTGVLALASTAAAQAVPCAELRGESLDRYNGLIDASEAAYGAADYAGAIDAIMQLKRICDDDPRLDFNLARAYQRDSNCNMARFWFELLLERVGDNPDALAEERPQLASQALDELKLQCSESARIAFGISERDAEVILVPTNGAEPAIFTYPFEGRVDPGEYRMTTRAPGRESITQTISFAANERHRVAVPELLDEAVAPQLRVECPTGIDRVRLRPAGSEPDSADEIEFACGEWRTVSPGTWTASMEVDGFRFEEEVTTRRNRDVEMVIAPPAEPDTDLSSGDVGWLLVGTGSALAVGGATVFALASLFEIDVLVPAETDPLTGEIVRLERSTEDIDDRALAMRIGGASVGGVGIALVITGIILVATDDDGDDQDQSAWLVQPRADGFSIGFHTRF